MQQGFGGIGYATTQPQNRRPPFNPIDPINLRQRMRTV
jgi:hypothetical protein